MLKICYLECALTVISKTLIMLLFIQSFKIVSLRRVEIMRDFNIPAISISSNGFTQYWVRIFPFFQLLKIQCFIHYRSAKKSLKVIQACYYISLKEKLCWCSRKWFSSRFLGTILSRVKVTFLKKYRVENGTCKWVFSSWKK